MRIRLRRLRLASMYFAVWLLPVGLAVPGFADTDREIINEPRFQMREKMSMRTFTQVIALLIATVSACYADILEDPLHGCIIGTSCSDNGTVTPNRPDTVPTFTFTVSPGPNTGDFLVEILIPDSITNAASLHFSISGTKGGSQDTSTIPTTDGVLKGHWTNGSLGPGFLGLTLANGSPLNNISAWLPYTQGNHCGSAQNEACDPTATGYQVYQIDLGINKLQSPSNPTKPILTLTASEFPKGSLLAGFLSQTKNGQTRYISTANSGAIFEADGPVPVPDGGVTFMLLGGVLVGLANLRRRLLA